MDEREDFNDREKDREEMKKKTYMGKDRCVECYIIEFFNLFSKKNTIF